MSERETESLRLRAEIFKALGHPTRLWIVEALANGSRCVADLAEGVEGGLSAVSQHLALLRQAGLVRDERRGRQIYYSLTFPCITEMCALLDGRKQRKQTPLERLRKAIGVILVLLVVGGGLTFALSRMCCTPLPPEMPEISATARPKFAPPMAKCGPRLFEQQNTTKKGYNHEESDDARRFGPDVRRSFRPGPGRPGPDAGQPRPKGPCMPML